MAKTTRFDIQRYETTLTRGAAILRMDGSFGSVEVTIAEPDGRLPEDFVIAAERASQFLRDTYSIRKVPSGFDKGTHLPETAGKRGSDEA